MKARRLHWAALVAAICLSPSLGSAQDHLPQAIGLYTAVQGSVSVVHPGSPRTFLVNVHDEVLFRDVIATGHESRTKAFLEDDSILTVGPSSRVEITEHLFDPDQNLRRVVVRLVQGQLRALVSRVFTGAGSRFEIHTPTSVAAARGTYFVVWVEEGLTGVVNIGESGRVDFTSAGVTVTLDPGQYSVAPPHQPPLVPVVYEDHLHHHGIGPAEKLRHTMTEKGADHGQQANEGAVKSEVKGTEGGAAPAAGLKVLASVQHAITGTMLKDMPPVEMPKDTVRLSHRVIVATPGMPASVKPTGGSSGPGAAHDGPSSKNSAQARQDQESDDTDEPDSSSSEGHHRPGHHAGGAHVAPPVHAVAPVAGVSPVPPPAVVSGAISTLPSPLK